jgi:hypothetical protein
MGVCSRASPRAGALEVAELSAMRARSASAARERVALPRTAARRASLLRASARKKCTGRSLFARRETSIAARHAPMRCSGLT